MLTGGKTEDSVADNLNWTQQSATLSLPALTSSMRGGWLLLDDAINPGWKVIDAY